MKKGIIAAAAAIILAGSTFAFAQGFGHGYRGFGPGHYGMGPGMMWGYGGGYGRGAGNWTPPCWQFSGYGPTASATPLTKDQAKALVEAQIVRSGNPNLKVGTVSEKDGNYVVEIVTKDNSLVDRVLVPKDSGYTQRAF